MDFSFSGPYPAICFQQKSGSAERRSTALLRATFDIADGGTLRLRSPQPRINFREIAFGDAALSPPKRESDLAPEKPCVDLIVNGTAYAPSDAPAARFEVAVSVYKKGDDAAPASLLHHRRLCVTGPRVWKYGQTSDGAPDWTLGEPSAKASVPVRFDIAYGGSVTLEHEGVTRVFTHRENPTGVGYLPNAEEVAAAFALGEQEATALLSRWSRDKTTIAAPQVTTPGSRLTSPDRAVPLAGFGIVGKHWQLRHRHVGTMDAAWERERYPLMPLDFDPRYWCGAHPDMQLEELPSDCILRIDGMVPENGEGQTVSLALPAIQPIARVFDAANEDDHVVPLRLDTVSVDMDEKEVTLLYRVNVAHPASLVYLHLYAGVDA
jgi:hypothetical protein